MPSLWTWVALVVTLTGWLIPFVMLFVIPANRRPSSATAWLMLLFALPWVGLLIFILIGSPKLSPRRRALQRQINGSIGTFIGEARENPALAALVNPAIPERFAPYVRLGTTTGALPVLAGNQIELLTDYGGILAQIATDIDTAREFVHIQFYILIADGATEACFQALERAAARGVSVRVLYDPIGSRKYPTYRATLERMRATGVDARPMLPMFRLQDPNRPDLRNHRKIVVVDGEIAYTGSLNLIDRGYHRRDGIVYDELMARVRGPAADALDAVFRTDWFSETGITLTIDQSSRYAIILTEEGNTLCQVVPSGSSFETENNLKLFVALIHASRRRLVICNPYFVPDEALLQAVVIAALRGVEVTLINSEAQDQFFVSHAQRSYYEQLLRAGVRIRLYKGPSLLHTKAMSVDDEIAVIGSSNLDMRSFELNLEVTLICYDQAVTRALCHAEELYIARSRPLDLAAWQGRPPHVRLFENVSRLMAALL